MKKCKYCISNNDEEHDDVWGSFLYKTFPFKQKIEFEHDFTNTKGTFKSIRLLDVGVFVMGDTAELSVLIGDNDRIDKNDLDVVVNKKIKYCPMCGRKLVKGENKS